MDIGSRLAVFGLKKFDIFGKRVKSGMSLNIADFFCLKPGRGTVRIGEARLGWVWRGEGSPLVEFLQDRPMATFLLYSNFPW